MGRNARLVFIAKSARTFCYGALGVLLPVYLSELGLDAGELGVAVTLTLLASTAMTFMIRWPAERWGPQAALMAQAALIVVSAAGLPADPPALGGRGRGHGRKPGRRHRRDGPLPLARAGHRHA